MDGHRHLLSLEDLSDETLCGVIRLGAEFAEQGIPVEALRGQAVGALFTRTSTRTRTAFTVGTLRLGGAPVGYGPGDLQLNTGESVGDTGRVFGAMLDALVARTAGPVEELKTLAREGGLPVVNAMSTEEHPTQGVCDLATLALEYGDLSGIRVLYVGEGNNTAVALAHGLAAVPGARVTFAVPRGYGLPEGVLAAAGRRAGRTGATLQEIHDLAEAPDETDVVYTTRWQTTGTAKADPGWREVFRPFHVDAALLPLAARGVPARPAGAPGRRGDRRGHRRPPEHRLRPSPDEAVQRRRGAAQLRRTSMTLTDVRSDTGILARFDAAASADPEAAALTYAGVTLDRATLRRRTTALARRLGPPVAGTVVGVALERSADLVVAQLACWAAGAAFCVLDPASPPAHLSRQIRRAGIHTVIAGSHPTHLDDLTVVAPDAGEADPDGPLTAGGLAYVIFTSGSTGEPKAVAVTHANLAAVTAAWEQRYGLASGRDNVLQVAAIGFDVAVGDVARTMAFGGRLILPTRDELVDPYRLLELARAERVSYLEITPSLLTALGSVQAAALPALRCLVLGGERVDAGHLRIARLLLGPRGRLFNTYGLTECTIDSTVIELGPERLDAPLGEPFPGTTVTVRDAGLAVAAVGEAYVGGASVALGYLGDPAGTADRFVPDPDGPPGGRMFRTGDRMRRRTDDAGGPALDFLGRSDRQIKLSGVRIDVEEVEQLVAAQPGVAAAAVVQTAGRLVAHVQAEAGFAGTDRLQADLAHELPPSHRPRGIVLHDVLPVTAGGKVDRDRLTGQLVGTPPEPTPESGPGTAAEPARVAPADGAGLTTRVAVLMAELLGGPPDPDGDFFARGGASLQATVLLGRLRRELGVAPTSAGELWRHPTPRGLAAVCHPSPSPHRTGPHPVPPLPRAAADVADQPARAGPSRLDSRRPTQADRRGLRRAPQPGSGPARRPSPRAAQRDRGRRDRTAVRGRPTAAARDPATPPRRVRPRSVGRAVGPRGRPAVPGRADPSPRRSLAGPRGLAPGPGRRVSAHPARRHRGLRGGPGSPAASGHPGPAGGGRGRGPGLARLLADDPVGRPPPRCRRPGVDLQGAGSAVSSVPT